MCAVRCGTTVPVRRSARLGSARFGGIVVNFELRCKTFRATAGGREVTRRRSSGTEAAARALACSHTRTTDACGVCTLDGHGGCVGLDTICTKSRIAIREMFLRPHLPGPAWRGVCVSVIVCMRVCVRRKRAYG